MLKPRHIAIAVAIFCVFQGSLSAQNEGDREDLANFARYREENATLLSKIAKGEAKKPKAVLFGDSISDAWPAVRPSFFKDNNLIGRGSSGQTASRILLRMQRDVVDFHPKYVVILAGMNDVAQNGGYADQKNVIGYIASMCQIAKANRIRPIVGTLPPADHFFWKEDIGVHIEGANEKIRALNYAIRAWAKTNRIPVVDYEKVLSGPDGVTAKQYSSDSVHPNEAGYIQMEKILLPLLK